MPSCCGKCCAPKLQELLGLEFEDPNNKKNWRELYNNNSDFKNNNDNHNNNDNYKDSDNNINKNCNNSSVPS